jgi:hypothetical protein
VSQIRRPRLVLLGRLAQLPTAHEYGIMSMFPTWPGRTSWRLITSGAVASPLRSIVDTGGAIQ